MTEHFIIVGAQRSGTTGLYKMLEQHPDICMARPMRPEPKYFLDANAVEGGRDAYLARHFPHRAGQRLLGEKSTSYIERDDAMQRIKAVLPDAFLVFVLRDPVHRAYSNWRFSRKHELEDLDFESALDAEPGRLEAARHHDTSVSPHAYASRGLYVDYLNRWARHFPRDRFLIMLSEHLFETTEPVRNLFGKLGVAQDVPLRDIGPVNSSDFEDDTPPGHATERLRKFFSGSIEELRKQWQVDVSPWM